MSCVGYLNLTSIQYDDLSATEYAELGYGCRERRQVHVVVQLAVYSPGMKQGTVYSPGIKQGTVYSPGTRHGNVYGAGGII